MRLYAAIQVLFVHGQAHLGWPLPSWMGVFQFLPGVPIFFSISGFLIGLSWLRLSHNWKLYAWNRAFRIFPALWFCLLVSIILLWIGGKKGFLLSSQGVLWIMAQSTVVQFFNPEALRDFGVGVVNGSLWTIPVELQFYIAFPLLLILGACRKGFVSPWFFLILFGALSYFVWLAMPGFSASNPFLGKLAKVSLLPHLYQFLLGFSSVPLFARFGQKRSIGLLLSASSVLIVMSILFGDAWTWSRPLLWSSLPIGIGLIPNSFLRIPDLSYGLYLFHMPVMNFLIVLGFSGLSTLLPCLVAVVLLALVSWYCVEKPALSLKKSFQDSAPSV